MSQRPQPAQENKMGTMPIPKLLLTMSGPMMISMFIQALYNVVDSMFVSYISEAALTAVSLAYPMQLPTLRLGLSFASLWGVISFSISGFSFPVMAMHPVLQALSNLFPLRHYFLIYVDQALNGYSMAYSWTNYMALLIFMMLPFFVVHRLKEALVYYKYIP